VPVTMDSVRREVGATVTVVGVIGSPVAHSLSPLLHTTAFVALGLEGEWRSFAFEVPAGGASVALEAMRRAGIRGLSVTMPHKAAVAAGVDECSEVARQLGAVNCVVNGDGVLFGTNTDGEGFVSSLRRGAGFDPDGRRCVVVGAGGAARAVVLALAQAGAAEVAIVNRTPERAYEAAALAGPVGTVVTLTDGSIAAAVVAADLVVNATPVGMAGVGSVAGVGGGAGGGPGQWLVPPELLESGQVAADLVYAPRPTRWLAEAGEGGATVLDGLGMLVHQAAAQLVLWTGREPPVQPMWEAAAAASPSDA
jgi:shikimate dehydrogenase